MIFRQTVKRFFEPVLQKTARNYYIIAIISALLWSFYEVFSIIIIEKISFFVEKKDLSAIYLWIIIFFISIIIYFIYRIIYKKYNLIMVSKLSMYLDAKYLYTFLSLDNNYTEKIGTGRMISIMKTWLITWADLLRKVSAEYLRAILSVLIALIYIFSKWRYFAVFVIVILFIGAVWIYQFSDKPLPRRKKGKEINMEFDRLVVRWIMSKFEILQSGQYDREIKKDQYINTERAKVKITEKVWQWICYDGVWLITTLMAWWLITYIALGIYHNTFSFSSFILFSSISVLISQKVASLADIAKDLTDNFVHVTKLWEKIDGGIMLHSNKEWVNFKYKTWNIILQGISFWYEDNSVFNNFSLELKWGTKTAFVGESGWGKTTLIKLLAWYLRPDSGEIIIDGQKLSEVKLTDYYRHIGYLTQEPSVFDGTVWENLTYALDDNQEEDDQREQRIHEIIQLAKCEFIYEFEHWLQTEIGERWVRLSGWQKQRLAIAKIMLKNPNIILLDEPTSALDSFNEELVTEALHNLFKWRTVIVVAHRLQTVKNADRILYIEWGQVIEDGTHTSLIKKNGNYKKMLDLQSGF